MHWKIFAFALGIGKWNEAEIPNVLPAEAVVWGAGNEEIIMWPKDLRMQAVMK